MLLSHCPEPLTGLHCRAEGMDTIMRVHERLHAARIPFIPMFKYLVVVTTDAASVVRIGRECGTRIEIDDDGAETPLCLQETRDPNSRVTSLCVRPRGHAGMCQA